MIDDGRWRKREREGVCVCVWVVFGQSRPGNVREYSTSYVCVCTRRINISEIAIQAARSRSCEGLRSHRPRIGQIAQIGQIGQARHVYRVYPRIIHLSIPSPRSPLDLRPGRPGLEVSWACVLTCLALFGPVSMRPRCLSHSLARRSRTSVSPYPSSDRRTSGAPNVTDGGGMGWDAVVVGGQGW